MNRSRPASQPEPDPPPIVMATIDSLAQPYEILGLVHTAMMATSGIVPTARLMNSLANQAMAMGADAVIGIRLSQLMLPVASRARLFSRAVDHFQNTVVAVALGTAVHQLPAGDPSGIARPRSCRHLR